MGIYLNKDNTGIQRIINTYGHLLCILVFALSLLFLSSCSNSSGTATTEKNGAIAFSLNFPEDVSPHMQQPDARYSAVVSSNCSAYGISSIEAYIYDEENVLIARGGPWSCIDGSGLIQEIAIGENRRIVIRCLNEAGTLLYSGERTGILVALGTTTEAGVIDVSSSNFAPVLAEIADTSGIVDSPVVIDSSEIFATDEDVDDILTYELGNSPAFNAEFDPVARLFSWTPNLVNDYKVLFIVHDNGTPRKSDFQEVTIHTSGAVGAILPQFPILDAIGSRVVSPGDTVSIDLQGSSFIQGSITFSALDTPGSSTFDPVTGLFTWNTTSSDIGNHKIRFDMSNGPGIDYEDVTITVGNVNRPPVLTPIGSRWRTSDLVPISFVITATDPEDDILTYSLEEDPNGEYDFPEGASIDPGTQIFTWNGYPLSEENYQVRIVVTDNHGETDFEDVLIRLPAP